MQRKKNFRSKIDTKKSTQKIDTQNRRKDRHTNIDKKSVQKIFRTNNRHKNVCYQKRFCQISTQNFFEPIINTKNVLEPNQTFRVKDRHEKKSAKNRYKKSFQKNRPKQ